MRSRSHGPWRPSSSARLLVGTFVGALCAMTARPDQVLNTKKRLWLAGSGSLVIVAAFAALALLRNSQPLQIWDKSGRGRPRRMCLVRTTPHNYVSVALLSVAV